MAGRLVSSARCGCRKRRRGSLKCKLHPQLAAPWGQQATCSEPPLNFKPCTAAHPVLLVDSTTAVRSTKTTGDWWSRCSTRDVCVPCLNRWMPRDSWYRSAGADYSAGDGPRTPCFVPVIPRRQIADPCCQTALGLQPGSRSYRQSSLTRRPYEARAWYYWGGEPGG